MGDDKAISIFAKPASYRASHIIRGSSMIRGEQVANYLGCKLNPADGYEGDLCIYVKPVSLDNVKDGSWVDVVDGRHIIPWLNERPAVNVIAVSDCSLAEYRGMGLVNKAAVIRPHHCNFDNERRDRQQVRVVGYIGSYQAFDYPLADMQRLIEGLGLSFIYSNDYRNREEIINFYKQIDIQLVWASPKIGRQSIGPTKAVNAASFGIPTVAYPQVCYEEIEGKYIRADTVEVLLAELTKLKDDPGYYASWADQVEWTEAYHIGNVAEQYRRLA